MLHVNFSPKPSPGDRTGKQLHRVRTQGVHQPLQRERRHQQVLPGVRHCRIGSLRHRTAGLLGSLRVLPRLKYHHSIGFTNDVVIGNTKLGNENKAQADI